MTPKCPRNLRSLGAVALLALAAAGCPDPTPSPTGPAPPAEPPCWFRDVAESAGIPFTHFDPATPDHLMPETLGSGLAWIDYDADGWWDLLCVQDCPLDRARSGPTPTHKLYRNLGGGRFADATERVGLAVTEFGMGAAVGDFDNDGYDDLLLTRLGGLTLYHNRPAPEGGRRFVDVTAEMGLPTDYPHFATSAAWADLDGDGRLDLYVCNYVEIDAARPLICKKEDGVTFQCSPTMYPSVAHRVFRNTGQGFVDVSAEAGVAGRPAPGFGVVAIDLDGDGRTDLFVTNDLNPQFLWRNESTPGHIRLAERAVPSGCSRTGTGLLIAGMGVEAAAVGGSERPAIAITNFRNMGTVLFERQVGELYLDTSLKSGLGGPSLSRLGFGVAFLDADRDGNPDLITANGHVHRSAPVISNSPYRQSPQLYLGDGQGRFRHATARAGPDLARPMAGRGLARADFDNDGREDVAIIGVGDRLALFRNEIATPHAWLTLELIGDGVRSNRNAVGAAVTVRAGDLVRHHWVKGGGSYLSAHDRRLHLGLGPHGDTPARVAIRWPSGQRQEFQLDPGHWWRLREGQPEPERVEPSRPPPPAGGQGLSVSPREAIVNPKSIETYRSRAVRDSQCRREMLSARAVGLDSPCSRHAIIFRHRRHASGDDPPRM